MVPVAMAIQLAGSKDDCVCMYLWINRQTLSRALINYLSQNHVCSASYISVPVCTVM